jgi:hypothetical protein
MWQTIRKQTYRLLYFMGKEPPSSDEVGAELERLQQEPRIDNTENAARCDCQVLAGNKTVGCYPNIFVYACDFIGDSKPGLTGVPLPVGSCKNLPKGSS